MKTSLLVLVFLALSVTSVVLIVVGASVQSIPWGYRIFFVATGCANVLCFVAHMLHLLKRKEMDT